MKTTSNIIRKVVFTGLVLTEITVLCGVVGAAPTTYVDDDFNASTPGWGATHFATVQDGVSAADAGGTVNVAAGTYVQAGTVAINKVNLTIQGAPALGSILRVDKIAVPSYAFQVTAAGATIRGLKIEKTDKAGPQNLIFIGANNATVKDCEISGQYVLGDGDVSRAFEVQYGISGLTIESNVIHGLRQPGYINGSLASPTTGTITGNYVYGTRGWVIDGANLTFTGNTWGTGANANYLDIAILSLTPPVYYTDLPGLSAANSGAAVQDQRIASPNLSVVYVNAGAAAGGDGTVTKPSQTISDGILKVIAGGTVNVAAGTYAEDVNLNKTVKVLGAGAGSSIVVGPIGGPGSTFTFGASGIELDGFTITRSGNNTTDWNNSGLNTAGVAIQGVTVNGTVRNCLITGMRTAIDINNSGGSSILNNVITNNRTGLILRNQTDNLTVTGNTIADNWTVGVLFLDASGGANNPVQTAVNCTFSNNNIGGNWYGQIVDRQTGGSLPAPGANLKNFSGNWLGTASPVVTVAASTEPSYALQIPVIFGGTAVPPGGQPDICGAASANIDHTPWLDVGTDTSAAVGFQGDFHALHVAAASPQTGGSGRIQEGIDMVSGSTVHVAAGTYTGNVNLTKALTITGTSAAIDGDVTFDAKPITMTGVTLASGHSWSVTANGAIQDAIDASASGNTVNVAAGQYKENLYVDRPLSLLGPNASINPNTGVRGAEAVLLPATSDPDPNSSGAVTILYVDSDAVVIKGFTFDGDNTDLTSGKLVGTADVDACEAIAAYGGVGSITVANNIIKNISYAGLDFYNYEDPTATADNYIQDNQFTNIGHIPYGYGIGILIYNNFYAEISGNVMTAVRKGIQTGNYSQANPGTTASIHDNNIASTRFGLFYNLHYGAASPFSINDNTFSVVNESGGATRWDAVVLSSQQGTVSATIQNNTITASPVTQSTVGYQVWNCPTTGSLTIQGGSVGGCTYGAWVNNYDGYSSAGASSIMTLDGVSISGAGTAGVYVKDNPLNNNGATVRAVLQNGCSIGSSAAGILVDGADTSLSPGNTALSGLTGNYFSLINGAPNNVDATAVVFGGKNGAVMTPAELFATEDKILHKVDNSALGLVQIKTGGDWYVTPLSGSIQGAINLAAPGDTINVAAGTYAEAVIVNKSVTLLGADSANPCGGSQSVINAGAGTAITIAANNVTVKGFELQGATGLSNTGYTGAIIQNNKVTAGASGIGLQNIAGDFTVKDNCVNVAVKEIGSTATIGIVLAGISGSGTQVVEGNNVSGPLYGYLLADVNSVSPLEVKDGAITGVMQGLAAINYNLAFSAQKSSTFKVNGVTMSGFSGTSTVDARNFHAGVYVYTGGPDAAAVITATVTNVTVSGTGKINPECGGMDFADFSTGSGPRQNITVLNCTVQNNLNRGIETRGTNAMVTIHRSTITGNGGDPVGTGGNDGFGLIARNNAQMRVTECVISNPSVQSGYTVTALASDASTAPQGPTLTVSNCSIANNGNGNLARQSAGTLNASGNYWGGNSAATIASLISGVVDFTPYLDSGTDTGSHDGFQGDFHTLHVAVASTQTGATGRIQEGVNLVSGSTVIIESGLYTEAVNVENRNNLTLQGVGRDLVTIKPSTAIDWGMAYGSSRKTAIRIVNSDNFALKGVTLDCDLIKGDFRYGFLYWNSTGGLFETNRFQNMSKSNPPYYDVMGYLRGADGSCVARDTVTIRNNQFIDTGRLGLVTHDYLHSVIDGNTFEKTTDAFGYAMEIGSTSTAEVRNNVIHGFDFPAPSDGSASAGIYVENCFTTGLAASCTKNVVIEDNEIYGCQYGMVIGNEFYGYAGPVSIVATIQRNNIHHNLDGGITLADADNSLGSSVTATLLNNEIRTNGGYGIYAYTGSSGKPAGGGTLSVNVTNCVITGHTDAGFVLDEWPSGSTYFVSLSQNDLSGNAAGIKNLVASANIQAEQNWWGSVRGPTTVSNPGGNGNAVSGNVDFSPWLGDGTDTSLAFGFQPNATIHYTPTGLSFSTQPVGGTAGSPLASQPVVTVTNEIGGVASQYVGAVSVGIGANPGGGTLSGISSGNAISGLATFAGLSINNAGTGYTLEATAAGLNSATSDAFTIGKVTATVLLGGLNQTYDGTGKYVTATTVPFGLTVNLTYNGSASAPTNVGFYQVIGTVNEANYQGSATNTLAVTFSTNRFLAAAGNYVGLFSHADGITFSNAGYFNARVMVRSNRLATVSGNLKLDGNRVSFARMTFDVLGVSSVGTVERSKYGKGSLTVRLTLPLDGSDTMSGTVSNNVVGGWVSDIAAYREVLVSNYAGSYTMALSGVVTNYMNEPGGYGYGLVRIDSKGVIMLSASKLADGDNLAQRTRVSPTGQWPLFSWGASLGGGRYNSMIMGWLTVDPTNGITGNPAWIKLSGGKRYTSGFALEPELISSPYAAPPSGSPVITLPGGWGLLTLSGGGLDSDLVRNVQLTTANTFVFTNLDAQPRLRLVAKTGRLVVGFKPEEFFFQPSMGNGVILTNLNRGFGHFVAPTPQSIYSRYSGMFELKP